MRPWKTRTLIVGLAIVVAALVAFTPHEEAGHPSKHHTSGGQTAPLISADPTHYMEPAILVSDIPQGEAKYQINLRNVCNRPIMARYDGTSCGCISVRSAKEEEPLAIGAKLALDAGDSAQLVLSSRLPPRPAVHKRSCSLSDVTFRAFS